VLDALYLIEYDLFYLFSLCYGWTIVPLALNNNHSLNHALTHSMWNTCYSCVTI
jgi:hypothetical protein